jgi:uncharacterized Tic20 family protein
MSSSQWYWSQRGSTMGPLDLDEIRRLVSLGSIEHATWIYDPRAGAWVVAGSVAELDDALRERATRDRAPDARSGESTATTAGPSAPPDSAPRATFCRFCGAAHAAGATRCGACGRETGAPSVTMDPKLAAILCRCSVLTAPVLTGFAFLGPGIVWAMGASDPRVVAEAKAALNQLLTLAIALVGIWILGIVGAIIIVGPIFAAIATAALAVYCVWMGIVGLVALSDGKPFSYRCSFALIR